MKHEKYYRQFLENNPYPRSLKSLEVIQGFSSIYLRYRGKKLVNFSSSDYLGLANHPNLVEASSAFVRRYGVGASASRLVSGNFDCYAEIESRLARALNKPAALILGSGYQANQSVLEALLNPVVLKTDPLVFCDKLCHASLLAGMKSVTRLHRFRHNDLTHLKTLLEKHAVSDRPIFIVAESIYSMEGDRVDLPGLIELAKKYEAFLYIDDAHATGVYGEDGFGYAVDHAKEIAMVMGTFSKAWGSFGGFVGCSEDIKTYLINKCPGLIYSTALSPAILGAIHAALELLPNMQDARVRVLERAERLRVHFRQENLDCGASNTHIIPWIIGDAKKTLYASRLLIDAGILGTGIQPPSVPHGKSRIRFALSAAHTDADIQQLCDAVKSVRQQIE